MKLYNPLDNYWLSEDGQVYSSKQESIVPATNPEYVAWLKSGNSPSFWPRDESGNQTLAALEHVLNERGLFFSKQKRLKNYLSSKLDSVLSAGIIVKINEADIEVDTTAIGMSHLLLITSTGGSVDWFQSNGKVTLSAEDVSTIAKEARNYVSDAYSVWQQLNVKIDKQRSTITEDQIESANWPSTNK